MKNFLLLMMFSFLSVCGIQAQQDYYKWRVGIHGGITPYYGDFSTGNFLDYQPTWRDNLDGFENLSYGISIEKSISQAWGLRALFHRGSFSGDDRARDFSGELIMDNESFDRGLNFKNEYWDVSLTFLYYFDNDKIFDKSSFFSPYVGLGLSFMDFEVMGDRYIDGNRYYYLEDGRLSITPDGGEGNIVERDRIFETNLADFDTEGKDYTTNTLTIPFVTGMKFRLGKRFNLNLELQTHMSFTDYLDDVSGDYPENYESAQQEYLSDPTNFTGNRSAEDGLFTDFYSFAQLSVHYNFGYKTQSFTAPAVYYREPVAVTDSQAPVSKDKTEITAQDSVQQFPNKRLKDLIRKINELSNRIAKDKMSSDEREEQMKALDSLLSLYKREYLHYEADTPPDSIQKSAVDGMNEKKKNQNAETEHILPTKKEKSENVESKIPETKGDTTVLQNIIQKDSFKVTVDTTIRQKLEEELKSYRPKPVADTIIEMRIEEFKVDSLNVEEVPEEVIAKETDPDSLKVTVDTTITEQLSEEQTEIIRDTVLEMRFEKVDPDSPEESEIKEEEFPKDISIDSLDVKVDTTVREELREKLKSGRSENEKSDSLRLQSMEEKKIDTVIETRIEKADQATPEQNQGLIKEEEKRRNADKKISKQNREIDSLRSALKRQEKINRQQKEVQVNSDVQMSENRATTDSLLIEQSRLIRELQEQMDSLEKAEMDDTEVVKVESNSSEIYQSQIKNLKGELKENEKLIESLQNKVEKNKEESVQQKALDIENKNTLSDKIKEKKEAKPRTDFPDKVVETKTDTVYVEKQRQEEIESLQTRIEKLMAENEEAESEKINALINKLDSLETALKNAKTVEKVTETKTEIVEKDLSIDERINSLNPVRVFFDNGKDQYSADFNQELNKVKDILEQNPKLMLELRGFTDSSGDPEFNKQLSMRRAQSIQSFFTENGIASDRIEIRGMGIVENSRKHDSYARRVDIEIKK